MVSSVDWRGVRAVQFVRRVAQKSEGTCKAKSVVENVAAATAMAAAWRTAARKKGNTARAAKTRGAAAGAATQMREVVKIWVRLVMSMARTVQGVCLGMLCINFFGPRLEQILCIMLVELEMVAENEFFVDDGRKLSAGAGAKALESRSRRAV